MAASSSSGGGGDIQKLSDELVLTTNTDAVGIDRCTKAATIIGDIARTGSDDVSIEYKLLLTETLFCTDEGRERCTNGETGATLVGRLITLLNQNSEDNNYDPLFATLHSKCARALSNISADSDTNRAIIASHSGIAAIVSRLKLTRDPTVQLPLCGAIVNLTCMNGRSTLFGC
jgi:hypothetical protein